MTHSRSCSSDLASSSPAASSSTRAINSGECSRGISCLISMGWTRRRVPTTQPRGTYRPVRDSPRHVGSRGREPSRQTANSSLFAAALAYSRLQAAWAAVLAADPLWLLEERTIFRLLAAKADRSPRGIVRDTSFVTSFLSSSIFLNSPALFPS